MADRRALSEFPAGKDPCQSCAALASGSRSVAVESIIYSFASLRFRAGAPKFPGSATVWIGCRSQVWSLSLAAWRLGQREPARQVIPFALEVYCVRNKGKVPGLLPW